jgi:nucleotide-binding universal stress UspA family protein
MSLQVKKILFATDLSQHAQYAFSFASSIADFYGASIVILHVMEEMSSHIKNLTINHVGVEKWNEIRKKVEMEAREILIGKKRDKVMIRQGLDTFWYDVSTDYPEYSVVVDEVIIKEGHIADVIVKQAEDSACDLIVMAYYSRNMVAEAMMHGVTRKVLRRSKKPVLLVPMPEDK